MTSSFTLPGGTFALFRAEPVASLADQQDAQYRAPGDVPTHWVLVKRTSNTPADEFPDTDVRPPNRPADYVGQIIAVAVPPPTVHPVPG